jgi:hypothetical protein
MNANELADQVEIWGNDLLALNMKGGIPVTEGAKLIRQQADRIDALEENLDITDKAYRIQQRYIAELEKVVESSLALNKAQAERQAKTLTDDDLFKVYADLQENYTGDNFPVDLGRAILRKAQEK